MYSKMDAIYLFTDKIGINAQLTQVYKIYTIPGIQLTIKSSYFSAINKKVDSILL